MRPNAEANYNPDPHYLRELIKKAGLSQAQAAKVIGIQTRTMQRYLTHTDAKNYTPVPYCVQYALEVLAFLAHTDQEPPNQ